MGKLLKSILCSALITTAKSSDNYATTSCIGADNVSTYFITISSTDAKIVSQLYRLKLAVSYGESLYDRISIWSGPYQTANFYPSVTLGWYCRDIYDF